MKIELFGITDEQLAEWEATAERVKLPPLEVEDEDDGTIIAGGAFIANVPFADDFPCLDETDVEEAQGERVAIRDMIVAAVNAFPTLLAEVRRLRVDPHARVGGAGR